MKFYFRCTANPKAPILVLETFWEAEDMKRNPDYIRVDADGNEIKDEEREAAENPVPLRSVFDSEAPKASRKRSKRASA
jgi:hypothetical protein